MPKDKGWHKETRLNIIDFLKKSGYNPISSHTGKGEISLYIKNNKQSEKLSEPDIVVPKKRGSNRIRYIIEIEEESPSPKKIFGTVCSVKFSETCVKGSTTLYNENTRLIIIVTHKAMFGKGRRVPNKQPQFSKIEKIVNGKLLGDSLAGFVILSDRYFFDYWNIDEIFE